jgi:hypothetical protein
LGGVRYPLTTPPKSSVPIEIAADFARAVDWATTSRRSAVRRPGRTRLKVTPRSRRTNGETGTTTTTPRPPLTRSGSRCLMPEKLPSEKATQSRKRAKEGRPLRRPLRTVHDPGGWSVTPGVRSVTSGGCEGRLTLHRQTGGSGTSLSSSPRRNSRAALVAKHRRWLVRRLLAEQVKRLRQPLPRPG